MALKLNDAFESGGESSEEAMFESFVHQKGLGESVARLDHSEIPVRKVGEHWGTLSHAHIRLFRRTHCRTFTYF